MRAALLRLLGDPQTLARMSALAAGAPAAAPVSVTLPLAGGDGDWLALLPASAPYWYRARPERGEYRLAIGHALHVASSGPQRFAALDNAYAGLCRDWRQDGHGALAFAGFACDPDNERPLPNALLAIPALLLENLAGHCQLTLTAPAGRLQQMAAAWPQLLLTPTASRPPTALRLPPNPLARSAWLARVAAALRAIGGGELAKVVLSRQQQVVADAPFALGDLLGRLAEQQPASVIYAHGAGSRSFLGATPERLVRRHGRQVAADALAGTAWPGSRELDDAKNRHEQSLVVSAIRAALTPLCVAPPAVEAARERELGHLRHLRSRIGGELRPGTTLFELLGALHPTPAVGGFPADAAQRWQAAHGERRDGWYAGGVGVLDPAGDGEFSVALRCALIDGATATLQAGAGIVAGSEPEQELAETDAKLQTLLAALGSGDAARQTPRCA